MADNLSFFREAAAYVEAQAFATRYPSIQYPLLVPVDMSAPEGAETVQWYVTNGVGKAGLYNNRANDIPFVELTAEKKNVQIETYDSGYKISWLEAMQGGLIGRDLSGEKATLVRRILDEQLDTLVLDGVSAFKWDGLLKNTNVTAFDVPADGVGSSRLWSAKSAELIIRDINMALIGVYAGSKTVELADTILVPPDVLGFLAGKYITGTSDTVYQAIMRNNVYTLRTGRPLTIIECRGLEDAAASSGGRFIAYRKAPDVLKLHLPMPLMFLDGNVTQLEMERIGFIRTGGLEVRLAECHPLRRPYHWLVHASRQRVNTRKEGLSTGSPS